MPYNQNEQKDNFMEQMIVIAAASTIDWSKCSTIDDLEKKVAIRSETIKNRLLNRDSIALRALSAIKIRAKIISVGYEKSSTRYVIKFKADKQSSDNDEIETIRSDRTDGINGELVKKMWEGLEGKHVIIYKTLEKTNNPRKPTARVAPFVEVIK